MKRRLEPFGGGGPPGRSHQTPLLKVLAGTLCAGVLLTGTLRAQPAFAQEESTPVPQHPVISQFNENITFYAAFDGQPIADMSAGRGAPTGNKQDLSWAAGKRKQALQAKNNAILYEAADNVDFENSGSLAVWVALGERLDRDAPVQLGFVTIRHRGSGLALARQGGIKNGEALMVIVGSNINKADSRALAFNDNSRHWQENEWHLLVANWGKDYVELSVDGSVFNRSTVTHPLYAHTADDGTMSIAGNGTSTSPYRLDELFIFSRPLSNEEAAMIYAAGATPE